MPAAQKCDIVKKWKLPRKKKSDAGKASPCKPDDEGEQNHVDNDIVTKKTVKKGQFKRKAKSEVTEERKKKKIKITKREKREMSEEPSEKCSPRSEGTKKTKERVKITKREEVSEEPSNNCGTKSAVTGERRSKRLKNGKKDMSDKNTVSDNDPEYQKCESRSSKRRNVCEVETMQKRRMPPPRSPAAAMPHSNVQARNTRSKTWQEEKINTAETKSSKKKRATQLVIEGKRTTQLVIEG